MKLIYILINILCVLLSLAGCAFTPSPIVQQPMAVNSQSAKAQRETNGAIFQASSYRPLFEDVKGRLVGDILTIAISENTSAGKAAANSGSKSGSAAFAAPVVLGLPAATLGKAGISTTSATKFDEKGAASASNTFTGTIAVTVIDVLPNGNLVVSGEKQIAFDKGNEFVRFSGIVNPQTVTAGNVVASTQVANARFEYRSTSHVDLAEVNSLLTRFFLSFIPL